MLLFAALPNGCNQCVFVMKLCFFLARVGNWQCFQTFKMYDRWDIKFLCIYWKVSISTIYCCVTIKKTKYFTSTKTKTQTYSICINKKKCVSRSNTRSESYLLKRKDVITPKNYLRFTGKKAEFPLWYDCSDRLVGCTVHMVAIFTHL